VPAEVPAATAIPAAGPALPVAQPVPLVAQPVQAQGGTPVNVMSAPPPERRGLLPRLFR